MKLTEAEESICREYGARDSQGYVHCCECPLVRPSYYTEVMCKKIGHYDKDDDTWVLDAWDETERGEND